MKGILTGVLTVTGSLLCLATPVTLRAEPPKVLLFRVQEVNQKTYFHFLGVVTGKKPATFLLIYPKARPEHVDRKKLALHELLKEKNDWVEEKLVLEPAKAKKVSMPAQGFNRDEKTRVQANDLEGNWALAQAAHFALLEAQTPDFGFYGFAHDD